MAETKQFQVTKIVDENFLEDKQSWNLRQWGALVLNTTDPNHKAEITLYACKKWLDGEIKDIGKEIVIIDQPSRPEYIKELPPSKMPRKKNNKDGLGAMIHLLTHVENIAIELSWDIVLRFDIDKYNLPKQFFDDWVRIAGEEAKHYNLAKSRLEQEYGKTYGDLPVHAGLWDDALKTKDCLLDRLVLEHCVHEARGVDVTALLTIPRFEEDKVTQSMLRDVILIDEITHVRDGLTWFKHVCKNNFECKEESEIVKKFHETVKRTLRSGCLPPPFEKDLRLKAGMTEDYYMPIAKEVKPK